MYPTGDQKRPSPGSITGECVKTDTAAGKWQCNSEDICVAVLDGLDLDGNKKQIVEFFVVIIYFTIEVY